ncbi:MAG: response regulator transcription factor [Ruminococcaceae bacterium]|nr:response regulator transcription factor [Oscillospiraceae bacterium]
MIYKIAICDDSAAAREHIAALTADWAKKSGISVHPLLFSSAEAFLFCYAEEKDFDILLLDIEMGPLNGIELAKKVRAENKEIQIIFISGYQDYISEGYDVEALHYILKPVDSAKLFAVLDRAREKLKKNEQALLLNTSDGTTRLPLYAIRYLEVRSNYVTIHADEVFSVKISLSSLENSLDDSFFRIGRSHVVNMRYIRKITKTEVFLSNGDILPLSRNAYEPLNRAFINYF